MAREEGVEEIVDRADLLDQRGAHARLLRRARRRARRLRRDRPPLPEGSRRPAHRPTPCASWRRTSSAPPAGRTVELHSHCTIGLAPFVYVEGLRAGFQVLHTAVEPLAPRHVATRRRRRRSATSRPRASRTGSTSTRSRAMSRSTSASSAARRACRPGEPQEFDATYYHHQLAGRHGLDDPADARGAAPARALRRRARGGRRASAPRWAIRSSSRPVSQLVATQAVRNVIDGERWTNVSDETVRYFLGHYGEPPRPSIPDVADRVLARPAGEAAARLRAAAPRRRAGALRHADLRRGAAAPADDARASRWTRCGRSRDERGRADRRRDRSCALLRELAAQAGRSPTCACRRATTWWCGAVRLDDVRGFVLDVDGTLVHRAGARGARPPARRRGARPDPRVGPAVRDLHERQPRGAGRVRRRPARRRSAVEDDELLTPLCCVQAYLERAGARRCSASLTEAGACVSRELRASTSSTGATGSRRRVRRARRLVGLRRSSSAPRAR